MFLSTQRRKKLPQIGASSLLHSASTCADSSPWSRPKEINEHDGIPRRDSTLKAAKQVDATSDLLIGRRSSPRPSQEDAQIPPRSGLSVDVDHSPGSGKLLQCEEHLPVDHNGWTR
ncbi:hypothetical protein Taro_005877 [Colocasia esculenta]|uniref:Uncharacterized protein n=1 Tax=Colocasia esculenta TaxID=4460 RepID=A0A843TUD3_COLES|nr:hypothetical protein [Colocasia esculenta]